MTLSTDIAQIAADSSLWHQIVHGTAGAADVTTEGGNVPTLAKALSNLGLGQVRGAWTTATAYVLGDVVTTGGTAYRCVVAHTAGATFAGDLPTKWVINAAVSTVMQAVVTAATIAAARALLGPYDDVVLNDVTTGNASAAKHGFLPKLPNDAALFLTGVGTWLSPAPYVSQARSTSAPNATVPAHVLSVFGAEADIDVCINPKGQGAILAAIPDNTNTGGNKRGVLALDLQRARTSPDQVALGSYSAIIVGANNKIAAGGSNSVIICGSGSEILHDNVTCHGALAKSRQSRSRVQGSGAAGQQGEEYIVSITTNDASPTLLYGNGTSIPLDVDNETVTIFAQVSGYQTGTPNAAGYVVEATAKRVAGMASCALVGTPVVRSQEDNAAWNVSVSVDTTAVGGVDIKVTGAAGVTITWFAWVRVARNRRT